MKSLHKIVDEARANTTLEELYEQVDDINKSLESIKKAETILCTALADITNEIKHRVGNDTREGNP